MKYFLQHFLLIVAIKEADSMHKIRNNRIGFFTLKGGCSGLLASPEYATAEEVGATSREGFLLVGDVTANSARMVMCWFCVRGHVIARDACRRWRVRGDGAEALCRRRRRLRQHERRTFLSDDHVSCRLRQSSSTDWSPTQVNGNCAVSSSHSIYISRLDRYFYRPLVLTNRFWDTAKNRWKVDFTYHTWIWRLSAVIERRSFPVPRSICSWWVTTYVAKASAI